MNLEFDSPMFGRGAFLQTLTPVEPLTQRMIHHVYINNYVPTFVAKFFLYSEALMVGVHFSISEILVQLK